MIYEIIGWLGSLLVVFAYAMNIYGKLAANSVTYYLFNIFGSFCLIINTFYHRAIPSAVVNIIWVGIAVLALVKTWFLGKKR